MSTHRCFVSKGDQIFQEDIPCDGTKIFSQDGSVVKCNDMTQTDSTPFVQKHDETGYIPLTSDKFRDTWISKFFELTKSIPAQDGYKCVSKKTQFSKLSPLTTRNSKTVFDKSKHPPLKPGLDRFRSCDNIARGMSTPDDIRMCKTYFPETKTFEVMEAELGLKCPEETAYDIWLRRLRDFDDKEYFPGGNAQQKCIYLNYSDSDPSKGKAAVQVYGKLKFNNKIPQDLKDDPVKLTSRDRQFGKKNALLEYCKKYPLSNGFPQHMAISLSSQKTENGYEFVIQPIKWRGGIVMNDDKFDLGFFLANHVEAVDDEDIRLFVFVRKIPVGNSTEFCSTTNVKVRKFTEEFKKRYPRDYQKLSGQFDPSVLCDAVNQSKFENQKELNDVLNDCLVNDNKIRGGSADGSILDHEPALSFDTLCRSVLTDNAEGIEKNDNSFSNFKNLVNDFCFATTEENNANNEKKLNLIYSPACRFLTKISRPKMNSNNSAIFDYMQTKRRDFLENNKSLKSARCSTKSNSFLKYFQSITNLKKTTAGDQAALCTFEPCFETEVHRNQIVSTSVNDVEFLCKNQTQELCYINQPKLKILDEKGVQINEKTS